MLLALLTLVVHNFKPKKCLQEADPEDRRLDFVPKKYDCLRKLPTYDRFYNDRYQRCLDLYLAPRQRKMKVLYFFFEDILDLF